MKTRVQQWGALVLALLGGALVVIALTSGGARLPTAPQPATSASASPSASQSATPKSATPSQPHRASKASTSTAPRPQRLKRSAPVQIDIPAIGVSTSMIKLGLNPDGTMAVPAFSAADKAGWFTGSPSPGQVGPSVIVGHVDSPHGPAVFYRLGALKRGDTIKVLRADGVTVVFTVTKAATFEKSSFPTEDVYGDIHHPGLRLITCGGAYEKSEGGYQANVVIFATLTKTQPPKGR